MGQILIVSKIDAIDVESMNSLIETESDFTKYKNKCPASKYLTWLNNLVVPTGYTKPNYTDVYKPTT